MKDKPKVQKHKLGKIIFCDCLDTEYGLPSIEDNSYDLGFTDPKWGVKMQQNTRTYIDGREMDNSDKVHFDDTTSPGFNKTWFLHLDRICKRIILVLGDKQIIWFIRHIQKEPKGILPIFWKNSPFGCGYAKRRRHSHYLLYGKFDTKFMHSILAKRYTSSNVEPFTYYWGATNKEKHFNHPSPKGLEIPMRILKELNPKSMIDPFSGSGTYVYAAHILNIPFLGYEINDKEYCKDHEWRFAQKNISRWIS
ncbi:MAG: DNA methyltransferase [Promethearchaeia archaeon]